MCSRRGLGGAHAPSADRADPDGDAGAGGRVECGAAPVPTFTPSLPKRLLVAELFGERRPASGAGAGAVGTYAAGALGLWSLARVGFRAGAGSGAGVKSEAAAPAPVAAASRARSTSSDFSTQSVNDSPAAEMTPRS